MTHEEIKEKVRGVIEEIRPFIQADGGDIQFVDITEDLIVQVSLAGACSGCAMKTHTLHHGVEKAIVNEVPEITAVVEV